MRFLVIATLIINSLIVTGQIDYNIIELEPTKGKTRGSNFVGIDKDGFIYTTSIKQTYVVFGFITRTYLKVFNAGTGEMQLEKKLEGSKELKAIDMQYLGLTFIDDKPMIICKKIQASKPYDYYGVEIDRNGTIVSKPYKIGVSGDCRGFRNESLNYGGANYSFKSHDGNYTFISQVSCANDELKDYRVLELDENLAVENSFSFKLDYDMVNNLSFSDAGEFIYLKARTSEKQEVDGKLFKKWVRTNRLFKISKQNGAIEEINVEDAFLPLVIGDFRINATADNVVISGQIIQERGFAGIFSAVINPETNEIEDIQTKDFDIDFVTQYWSDRKKRKEERRRNRKGETEDDENFSTDFLLIETFDTPEDGQISIFQDFELDVVQRTRTDANGNVVYDIDYYYYYRNVIAVKTDRDGKIVYTKLLPFYQVTVDFDPGKGYSVLEEDGELYFLHGSSKEMTEMIEEGKRTERKRNRSDRFRRYASITHIDQEGNVSTQEVFDIREKDVQIYSNVVAVDEENKQFVIVSPITKLFNFKKTKVLKVEIKD